ncbi:hypothetical protein ACHAWF_009949 [Thalassiosira exigua]
MTRPPPVFTEQRNRLPRPQKRCRNRNSRKAIEAELFTLRSSRKGFVKSESLRLSPRHEDEDEDEDERIARDRSRKGRWRERRCGNKVRSLIEKIQDAARRAKVLELRLVGRRSWWPQFDGDKSKGLVASPPPPKKCPEAANDEVEKIRDDANSTWIPPSTIDRKTECQHSSNPPMGQLLVEFDSCRVSNATNTRNGRRGRKKEKFAGFWRPRTKTNANVKAVSGEEGEPPELVQVGSSSSGETLSTGCDDASAALQLQKKEDNGDVPKDEKAKRNRLPVIATAASISVSGLGVAAAIIFL